jgi:nucleoside-diphosphate-sugar epimerase
MYTVSGVTGQVGGAVARNLLAANRPVRAVLRDPKRADAWARRGCEVAYADFNDPEARARRSNASVGTMRKSTDAIPSAWLRIKVFHP